MKISQEEIDAAFMVFVDEPAPPKGHMIAALEAAYTVRKQAKRLRKGKSAQPTHFKDKPIADMAQSEYDEMMKVHIATMAPKWPTGEA